MIGAMLAMMLLQPAAAKPAQPSQPDLSTKAGVEAEAKVYFSMLDTSKDGKVDRAEAQAFHNKAVARVAAIRRAAESKFNELDTDKDGALSREEYLAIAGTPPPAKEQWFDGNDANKDGRVELNEALARVRITFDALDTNKDGKLSSQEKAAARGGR
jgi:hypothetical protein